MKILRYVDVDQETEGSQSVRSALEGSIIGQSEAVNFFVGLIEKYEARLFDTKKPIGSVLFTGPTGVGKTRLVESFCESLVGVAKFMMIKVDCGEYQHSHEISKLIGSPPGYLGHRETPPLLNKDRIKMLSADSKWPFAVLLFDEIEKASDSLWHILLSVLDKGELTTGNNEHVDLTHTVICMTSNVGSQQMSAALGLGGLGFQGIQEGVNNEKIKHIGEEAAKRKFTTEFINRLDAVVACHALTKEEISRILVKELEYLQKEIWLKCTPVVAFKVSPAAQAALLEEGYDPKYNARNIKRAIDKNLRLPLARVVAAKAIKPNEGMLIDYQNGKYVFAVTNTRMDWSEDDILGDR